MAEKKFEIVCPPELMKKIENHCFSKVDVEVGGFLVGKVENGKSIVTHILEAKNTSAQSAQLTFTNKTWETAWEEMSEIGKDAKLVGWFHSHPNFGVFLSDYDKFIQNQFFHEDGMITIVVDPIRGKRGWFISIDKEVRAYAKEENTTREKLGESKKGSDENVDAIIKKSKEGKGGVSLGQTIAIALIFSILSSLGTYFMTSTQDVDYKGRIESLEAKFNSLVVAYQALAQNQSQGGTSTPSATTTGSPAPTPKQTVTSPKASVTPTTPKVVVSGLENKACPTEGKTQSETLNGKTAKYLCKKGENGKTVWKKVVVATPTSTSPTTSSSASPTPVKTTASPSPSPAKTTAAATPTPTTSATTPAP